MEKSSRVAEEYEWIGVMVRALGYEPFPFPFSGNREVTFARARVLFRLYYPILVPRATRSF